MYTLCHLENGKVVRRPIPFGVRVVDFARQTCQREGRTNWVDPCPCEKCQKAGVKQQQRMDR